MGRRGGGLRRRTKTTRATRSSAAPSARTIGRRPLLLPPDSDRHLRSKYERACRCYEKIKPEPYEVPTDALVVLRRVGYETSSAAGIKPSTPALVIPTGTCSFKGCADCRDSSGAARMRASSTSHRPRCHVRYCENGGDQYSKERYCARCFSPQSCSTCGKGPWCPCNFIPCCVDGCNNVSTWRSRTTDCSRSWGGQFRAAKVARSSSRRRSDDDDEGRPRRDLLPGARSRRDS